MQTQAAQLGGAVVVVGAVAAVGAALADAAGDDNGGWALVPAWDDDAE